MQRGRLLRQISLLVVFWLLNYLGVSKPSAEAKTLSNEKGHHQNHSAPVITEHPVDRTIKEGKGFSLVCSAHGNPRPRFKWRKNGSPITVDYRIRTRRLDSGSKLKIKDAKPEDSGDYHCVVKNSLGHISSVKARVQVRRTTIRGPHSRGTCKPYTGSICSGYLSSDGKTFIDDNKSQKQLEERILFAASILTDYTHSSCKDSLTRALCYNLFPPCQTGEDPRPQLLCKQACDVLHSACSREFSLLERRLGPSAYETIPNCSLLYHDGDCLRLVIGNKTFRGRECQPENSDVPQVKLKPLNNNYPVCRDINSGHNSVVTQRRKSIKVQNKEILRILRHVKSEIYSGQMLFLPKSPKESTYCFTASLPFNSLVSWWNFYNITPLLPNLRRPNNLIVPGVIISTLNSSVSTMLVPLGSAEKYKVHEKVVLKNVEFYYRVQSGHGSFIAKGEYDFCGTIFKLTVEKLLDGTIRIKGFSDLPVDLDKIETIFVSATPSNRLVSAIIKAELFELRLMKPVMEAYLTNDLAVKFSGQTYFGPTALPVHLEFFSGKLHGKDVLLVGITSSHLTMNEALKMLTAGFNIPYFDYLKKPSNDFSLGMTLSANKLDLKRTPFGGFDKEPLRLAFPDAVPWGLSLVTRDAIQEANKTSQVVKLFQAIIGRGRAFTIKATTDWRDVTLHWHFHNVSKTAVTPFDGVEMKMKLQLDDSNWQNLPSSPLTFMEISVDGSFYSSDQNSKRLPFTGQLVYQDYNSVLEGNFETQAVWKKAFGVDYLTLTNLKLGVSLPTNQSQQSRIRGEADLQLGFDCHTTRDNSENDSIKKDCVTGNLYLGFSDVSADHFFYGTLTPVSLQKLLEICNIRHKLPGALATIGFPEGFQISVARGVHDLQKIGGPVLQPGFLLKGKMSVLGIETSGVISLLPNEFLVDAKIASDEASEIIDDVTSLFLYNVDRAHSPKLFLKARMDPVPFVKAHIDGYARLFGIFEEVRMLVTRDSLQIYLSTDADKSFKISVQITTNYSSNCNHTHLSASVVFESGLSKLTRMASKQVVAMLEQEMSELKSARGEVQRLRRECAKTIKGECSICKHDKACLASLASCPADTRVRTPLNGSEGKYDSEQANVTPIDYCQRFVMEYCLAADTACHNACIFVSSKANKTCAAFQAAAASQRKLERGLRSLKRAEQFMYSELFEIHAISFKTNVPSTNLEDLYLETSLEITIFGQKEKLEGLRIEFNEFVKLASEIAKYAWDWYQKAPPQPSPRHPDNRPR